MGQPEDSLDGMERLLAMEEAVRQKIILDRSLSEAQRNVLLERLDKLIDGAEDIDGDDLDEGLAVYVRKLGPGGPRSGSATVKPED